MANTASKISALPAANSAVGSSKIPIVDGSNGNTSYITVANLLGNSPANTAPVRATRVISGVAPANSSANGVLGDVAFDSSFVYVCTQANTWKRAAIATW